MKTFFASDLHFLHKNIVKFTQRSRYTTQEQHDEWLVDLWNSQVSKSDRVWHLGDFSFGKLEQTRNILRQLNGQKFFIKGNHDQSKDLDSLALSGLIAKWNQYEETKIAGVTTCLFHFPICSWHKQGYGSYHLHGHCHNHLKTEFKKGLILDVGLDCAIESYGEAKFFTEDDIVAIMQQKVKYIADHHADR